MLFSTDVYELLFQQNDKFKNVFRRTWDRLSPSLPRGEGGGIRGREGVSIL